MAFLSHKGVKVRSALLNIFCQRENYLQKKTFAPYKGVKVGGNISVLPTQVSTIKVVLPEKNYL